MVFCRGCFSSYSRTGYISHLTQAKNPACLPNMEEEMDAAGVVLEDVDISMDDPDADESEQDSAIVFQGDFFGNDYQGADFDSEWPEEFPQGRSPEADPRPVSENEGSDDGEEVDSEEVSHPTGAGLHIPLDNSTNSEGPNYYSVDIPDYDSHARLRLERALHQKVHIQTFCTQALPETVESQPPAEATPQPGAAISSSLQGGIPPSPSGYGLYEAELHQADSDGGSNMDYAPFTSKLEWEVARWAKLRGPGSTALTDLLSIEGVHEKLGLSFKNSRELNRIIDGLPAQRPQFKREEIVVAGESYDVHFRDIIECVRALYGDPEFARHLVFLPERHYADADHTKRLYHDMHTGNWWWAIQKSIEKLTPGATVMPIIISSDKTQVTLFGHSE
ncbi:hypothetical protein EW026_g1714 [Hermanssonia centrifuga]|uniref:Uncharacterized protein n=1 Tax=Hermanssonia centrifuga TaxID=98765 RepID=A0A4S4KRD4_9APHY|nr:hypothetical protein EW026_g1714 [Hermanssonia centrifuga]